MKKFLLNASSGIGDIMFFLPAVLALKETYPDSQIGFLFRGDETTKETVSSILSIAHNKIDDLQYYNSSNFIHNFKVLLQLKLQKYEYGMILKYDGQSKSVWAALILKLVGCKTIALDGYVKENQYIDNIVPVAKRENIHNVDRCFECLKYFGINSEYNENIYYRRIFNKEKIEKTYTQLNLGLSNEEFIVLCVGANKVSFKINGKYKSNDVKNWPIENWIVLANSLNKENIRVVLVGGKNDIKKIIDCKERLDNSILNLVGRMNIAESISILEYAKMVVGCDTGLMHCAASLNKRTLMLLGGITPIQAQGYGKNSESIYLHKQCSPCFGTGKDVFCNDPVCMKEISVENVLERILNIC